MDDVTRDGVSKKSHGSAPLMLGVVYHFKTKSEAEAWRNHWEKKGYIITQPTPHAFMWTCTPTFLKEEDA